MQPVRINRDELVILDIAIKKRSVNWVLIAEATGFTQGYVSMLVNPDDIKRKNVESLKIVRDAIIKCYGSIVKNLEDVAA
jgi:hypothetical protein